MLFRAYALYGGALPQGRCQGAALLTRRHSGRGLSSHTIPIQAPPSHHQGGTPPCDACTVHGTGRHGNPPALAHGGEEHHSHGPYGSRYIQGSATPALHTTALPPCLHLYHRTCRAQLLRYLTALHHRDGAGEEESFYDIQRAAKGNSVAVNGQGSCQRARVKLV